MNIEQGIDPLKSSTSRPLSEAAFYMSDREARKVIARLTHGAREARRFVVINGDEAEPDSIAGAFNQGASLALLSAPGGAYSVSIEVFAHPKINRVLSSSEIARAFLCSPLIESSHGVVFLNERKPAFMDVVRNYLDSAIGDSDQRHGLLRTVCSSSFVPNAMIILPADAQIPAAYAALEAFPIVGVPRTSHELSEGRGYQFLVRTSLLSDAPEYVPNLLRGFQVIADDMSDESSAIVSRDKSDRSSGSGSSGHAIPSGGRSQQRAVEAATSKVIDDSNQSKKSRGGRPVPAHRNEAKAQAERIAQLEAELRARGLML